MRMVFAVATIITITATASAASRHHIQKETIACENRELMIRALDMISRKDYAAANTLWDRAESDGACKVFHKGDEVVRETREFLSGLSKIRLVGETTSYWIHNVYVDPKE